MAANGQQQCADSVIARSECQGSGHQMVANLVSDLAVVVAALHILAQWSDGPEVTGGFDEPKAARLSRAVLAALGIGSGWPVDEAFDPCTVVEAIGGIGWIGGGR